MIFCKAPTPGQVKTRLVPPLSYQAAAQVHIELSEKTLRLVTGNALCPVQVWCSPTTEHPFFQKANSVFDLSFHIQQGNDLGERMHHAFVCALKQFDNAVILGCDCPSLTQADLERGLSALNTNYDIILAPAEDGGYVLLGLNRPQKQLFTDMPWGTSDVLSETKARIKASELNFFELREQWDVDTFDDLVRYQNAS